MGECIISIKDLSVWNNSTKSYIIENINLDIAKGELLFITGSNGGGKTTFIKAICDSIPESLKQSGYIKKNGRLCYMPQRISFPTSMPLSVENFINIFYKNIDKYYLRKDMNYFNLNIDFKGDISVLSSGQIQKVMLILSMLSESEIVIMDEPDQNLDFDSQKMIYEYIISKKSNKTLIIVSHDIHNIISIDKDYARTICLNKGIHCMGSASNIHKMHLM
jgi:zinc transport system ATP-binding protein